MISARWAGVAVALAVLAHASACVGQDVVQDRRATAISVALKEVGVSKELTHPNRRLLTAAIELKGKGTGALRHIQPRREQFTAVVRGRSLPCVRLRGGSTPEDLNTLRFQAAFDLGARPPGEAQIRVRIPVSVREVRHEVRITWESPGSPRVSKPGREGWDLAYESHKSVGFEPSLAGASRFVTKGGLADLRVFARAESPRDDALRLVLNASPALFDDVLDADGSLSVDAKPALPLLELRLTRYPALGTRDRPRVRLEAWFEGHREAQLRSAQLDLISGGPAGGAVVLNQTVRFP